jgi:Family of unknown function (DUF6152)
MKRIPRFTLVAALALTVCGMSSSALIAHHSFVAQYDRNKPKTLVGPVTRLDWINPHARLFMDVKDENGHVTNWEVELAATAILIRRGWTRSAIKIGETVTVNGSLAKDGSNLVNATSVTLSDGTKVFSSTG